MPALPLIPLLAFLVVLVNTLSRISSIAVDNPYKLLNVPVDATEKVIKKAYRAMAVQHHPDKHSPEEAEKYSSRFVRISAAYEILMDPRKRRVIDQTLRPRQHGNNAFNRNTGNTFHDFQQRPPPRGPPRGRPPPPRYPHKPANPTIYNYYSIQDKVMPSFEQPGIWILHLFTSTKTKCPQCSEFITVFKQLATKLDALGYKIGAMNCAKGPEKCRHQEAKHLGGAPLQVSEVQFIPSITIVIGNMSQKVSGSPYVCMADADCTTGSAANKRLGNAAGLYTTIVQKILSHQVIAITQWSDLRKFLSNDSTNPSLQSISLLLWSARNEIDKILTHKIVSVAYSLNVTLGTIRNTMTTNKAFGRLYYLEDDLEHGLQRELFPLLLVQCRCEDFLFSAYLRAPYTGSSSSLDEVKDFVQEVIDQNSCGQAIQQAKQLRKHVQLAARKTLEGKSFEHLARMKAIELQGLARDLFGGDLDPTHRSGLSRAAILGMGEAEGGSRVIINKADIASALLEFLDSSPTPSVAQDGRYSAECRETVSVESGGAEYSCSESLRS